MRTPPATPRDGDEKDPLRSMNLRSSAAHIEHTEHGRSRADAAAARRYLRRRRELFLCVLVSVLGVLTARSIPLVAHERELCACRTALHGSAGAGASAWTSPGRDVNLKKRIEGVTPLRQHGGAAEWWAHAPEHGAVDVIVTDAGAVVDTQRGRVVLAEHCETRAPHVVHTSLGSASWSP